MATINFMLVQVWLRIEDSYSTTDIHVQVHVYVATVLGGFCHTIVIECHSFAQSKILCTHINDFMVYMQVPLCVISQEILLNLTPLKASLSLICDLSD